MSSSVSAQPDDKTGNVEKSLFEVEALGPISLKSKLDEINLFYQYLKELHAYHWI